MQKVDCKKCSFFYITWNKNFPYGCRAFSMQTKFFPSEQVLRSSGMPCLYFEKKIFTTPNTQDQIKDRENGPSSKKKNQSSFEEKA